ncbi:MAG: type I 3-dehydroquinate dehydratase [Desulfobacteraceae bacterium]|nr:type I 3-dehydroquinate dehydratase [Desulfobacteraceae bacterium]
MDLPDSHDFKGRICGCLVDCPPEDFPAWLDYPGIDLIEWRIDQFAQCVPEGGMAFFLDGLSRKSRHEVIATNRPLREMGAFDGPEELRIKMLADAARAGAEWVDLEHDAEIGEMDMFRGHGAKILLSWHNPLETPHRGILHARLESMCKTAADALKMVTFAQSDEDNLKILELIPLARKEFGKKLIAFCMGPKGAWSRLACLMLGSPWTYAQLPGLSPTAPGQLSVSEMREMLRVLDRK